VYEEIPFPPWRIKMVERTPVLSRRQRRRAITKAGFNTFLLKSDEVMIDLLTDSGTNAMFDVQWAAMMSADESYAGSRSFYRFEKVIREHYGLPCVVPTHQGRPAERIANQVLAGPGQYILSNMYFTTSKAHAERVGAKWIDVSILEAHDPQNTFVFKGNIDIETLRAKIAKIRELNAGNIAYIRQEACLNMAGGQPFSMENLEAVREVASSFGIPLLIDATRAVENCHFIKQHELGFEDVSVKDILRRMCGQADWLTASCKKDASVNIGGFLATNDEEKFEEVQNLVIEDEGFIHYGGLAGRDMEAIATGIEMVVDDRYIAHRVGQVRKFGEVLFGAGIPVVVPFGGHAVYLDAKRFLDHLPQDVFPAQVLAAELYIECGARSMERGIVSAGRNPDTGEHNHSTLELVRLTIPRMAYTDEHLQYVAEGVRRVHARRAAISGLRMIYESPSLRFFRARFERI